MIISDDQSYRGFGFLGTHFSHPPPGYGKKMRDMTAEWYRATRLRTHNQKMTVAAMQMAKVWAPRSYRVAMRRQSLILPNMCSTRLRRL